MAGSLQQIWKASVFGKCLRDGLGALEKSHAKQVQTGSNAQALFSVDADACRKSAEPQVARWDYCIGWRPGGPEQLLCLEFHPVRNDEVSNVIRKKQWMRDHIVALEAKTGKEFTRQFYWMPTGQGKQSPRIGIAPGSPQERQLASNGIQIRRRLPLDLSKEH